jgi:hypothetical protein
MFDGTVSRWVGSTLQADVMDSLFELLPNVNRAASEGYKVYLCGGGVLLALFWARLAPFGKLREQFLIALTILSAFNYMRWGEKVLVEKVDTYDLIHYYLNAKYFDELGYYDLYPACMLADHANDGPYFDEGSKYMAQDENGHGFQPISHALARGRIVRAENFTEERWEAFEHDALYLQRTVPGFNSKLWRQMIQDHGFNGTMAWVLTAGPLAEWVPVEYVKWLSSIDLALLAMAMALVWRAYGSATMTWAIFWILLSYSARWPTISWSYLRYDYLAALIASMALLRMNRPVIAGILTGYSGALRMFPVVWVWGPLMVGLAGLMRRAPASLSLDGMTGPKPSGLTSRVNRPLVMFGVAAAVMFLAFEGITALRYGPEPMVDHYDNMVDHQKSEQLSSRRIGLAMALPYWGNGEWIGNEQDGLRFDRSRKLPKFIETPRKWKVEDQKPLRYGLSLIYLLLVGWGLRKLRPDEAFGFGFVPFFLLTTASYYYYVTRVTLVLLHASDLKQRRNVFGLTWLLGLEMFSNWAETEQAGQRVYLVGILAWGLAIYAVVMGCWFLYESTQLEKDELGAAEKA